MLATNQVLANAITYKDQGRLPGVSSRLFDSLDIRIGEMTTVENNRKARIPSFRVVMNFGEGFQELKQSSAQLQDNYYEGVSEKEEVAADARPKARLFGMQAAAVTNFPRRSVGIPSFFLTLGVVSLEGENTGTVVLRPSTPCLNGSKVKLLNDHIPSHSLPRLTQVEYADTFHHLDVRVGTVLSLQDKTVDFGSEFGIVQYQGDYPLFQEGMQILRVVNLEDLSDQDNFLGVVDSESNLIPLTLERPLPNGRFLK